MEMWCERHEQVIDELEGHEDCHKDGEVLEPREPDFEAMMEQRMSGRRSRFERLAAMGEDR